MVAKLLKRLITRRNIIISFLLCLGGVALIAAADIGISLHAKSAIFTDIDKVPHKKAALVLGTIKYARNGRINRFYKARIEAAAELYKKGKVNAVIVSGDNCRKDYDEPTDMKNDLIDLGVPAEHIQCDFAGFRTLDSVVRADAIFDCKEYIIVSQRFHCERALFIAGVNNHNAVAYCAKDVGGRFGLKVRIREVAARVKAVLDCCIINKKPRFYGPKETINYRQIAATQ